MYLSMPLSALQMQTASCEYLNLLDKAIEQSDPLMRIAYVATYAMAQFNHVERCSQKAFNPMLGETFEIVTDKYEALAELCIHHPPVLGLYVKGKSGYMRQSTMRFRPKFVKGSIQAANINMDYIDLFPHGETYQVRSPGISINNIIIGTPYLDIVGKQIIKNLNNPERYFTLVEFEKRGWSQNSYQKFAGEIYDGHKNPVYRLEGKWSDKAVLTNLKTGEKQVLWEKAPYPENW